MTHFQRRARPHGTRLAALAFAATTVFLAAALVGVAIARTFTLQIAKNAKVTNQSGTTKTEKIVVNPHGFALYTLSGDSKSHPKCTSANGCFLFWPPLKVSSAKHVSKAPGIKGKLGVWHRDGFFQVTLAGHPLYRYAGDTHSHHATGEGVVSFGGTWHVRTPAGAH